MLALGTHAHIATRACARTSSNIGTIIVFVWANALVLAEWTPRSGMSELPGESSLPEMNPMNGVSDVLQAGVGGRSRAREAQEGPVAGAARPMARVLGPAHRRVPGLAPGLMSVPDLQGQLGPVGINQQRLFHQYLDRSPVVPVRLLRDIEERRRLFVEGCKAREAAFDANPPQLDSEAIAFTLALTSSEAVSPLAD